MKKVLIITYYWPPSGGSGVQRWMFFSKYLPEFGIQPVIITVDPKYGSYKFIDHSFEEKVKGIEVHKTKSSEPFNLYSKAIGKSKADAVPQGFSGESNPTLVQKIARFVRGNFFIPDARKGWIKHALKKAEEILSKGEIKIVITTGPPHSTHLVGLNLKKKFDIKWIADFRDPWSDVYYNKMFYKTELANSIDKKMEQEVISAADKILTIGPSMQKLLMSKLKNKNFDSSKFSFVLNGYDPEAFKNLQKEKNNLTFTICHLGVLSDNQPIHGFINALSEIFKSDQNISGKICIKLIGKISPDIINEFREKISSPDLKIINYLPHQEAIREIVNADLLINSLADVNNANYLISGKLMEYIATGNPIMCFGDPKGDASELLSEFKNTIVLDRDNKIEIMNFILSMYSKWELNENPIESNSIDKYSRYATTKQLAKLIDKI